MKTSTINKWIDRVYLAMVIIANVFMAFYFVAMLYYLWTDAAIMEHATHDGIVLATILHVLFCPTALYIIDKTFEWGKNRGDR